MNHSSFEGENQISPNVIFLVVFGHPAYFVLLSHIISETCYRQHGQTYDAIGCIAWKLLISGIGIKKYKLL